MTYLSNAGLYIVKTILGLYILLILIRFWLHWVRGNFRGPIGELLIMATSPVISPFKNLAKSPQSWAWICLLLAYGLTVLKNLILLTLGGYEYTASGLCVFSFAEIIQSSVFIFLVCIFASIIASWVAPYSNNPALLTARSLSEPLLLPARRMIPNFNGIDISPIAVIILLNLSLMLFAKPIFDISLHLGFPARFV